MRHYKKNWQKNYFIIVELHKTREVKKERIILLGIIYYNDTNKRRI